MKKPWEIVGWTKQEYYDWLSELVGEKIEPYVPPKPAPKPIEPKTQENVSPEIIKKVKPAKNKKVNLKQEFRNRTLPKVIELYKQGMTQLKISEATGVLEGTISFWLRKYVPGYIPVRGCPKKVPRPKKIAPSVQYRNEMLPKIIELNRAGKLQREIAEELNIKQNTISSWLIKYVPDAFKGKTNHYERKGGNRIKRTKIEKVRLLSGDELEVGKIYQLFLRGGMTCAPYKYIGRGVKDRYEFTDEASPIKPMRFVSKSDFKKAKEITDAM